MSRRAIITVLIPLVGVLTASAALLNPEQRHATFQPGAPGKLKAAVVVKPAQTALSVARWSGVQVQAIAPAAQTPVKVELAGRQVGKPQDALIAAGVVKQAGGAR